MRFRLYKNDCLEKLKELESDSIDSLITDPPAGISFMGKAWDSDKGGRNEWIEWMATIMRECHRVLKPGAHGLVWAIPRTSHWTATALEDAGFEVRDVVTHLFGSGFPKSHNLEKSTDGIAKGQGTALKPASEHWVLVRKPCSEKTVAANVLKHGTGGLNIDAGRIGTELIQGGRAGRKDSSSFNVCIGDKPPMHQGRFPANLVFSHTPYCTDDQCDIECAIKQLDAQGGISKSNFRKLKANGETSLFGGGRTGSATSPDDAGGASRFFYCAKISSSERNSAGPNPHPTVKPKKLMSYLIKLITPPNGVVLDPFMGSGSTGIAAKECGFNFIGIEKEKEYYEIAKARIRA